MKRCKITFFMNAYNNESDVEQTIKSILGQTERDIRLVLCNNGSTDRTGEICQKWAKKDTRIQYYTNQQNLITDAGVKHPQREYWPKFNSEYVSMMDADDLLDKNFAKEMYQAAKKYNAEMVVCGTTMFEDKTNRIVTQRIPPSIWTKDMQKLSPIFPELYGSLRPVWGKIFRLDFFERYYDFAWPIDEQIANGADTYTTLGYLMKCQSFIAIDKSLHFYRMRQKSAFFSANLQTARIEAGAMLYQRGMQCLKALGIDSNDNKAFLNSVYWGHLCDLLNLLERSNQMNGQEKLDYLAAILNAPLSQQMLLTENNFSIVFTRIRESLTVVENQNEDDPYIMSKCHYLQRLTTVIDNKDEQQPNIILFILYLSALIDKANLAHVGKLWLRRTEWGYLPEYAKRFLRLSVVQQQAFLENVEELKTYFRNLSGEEQLEAEEERLLAAMNAGNYEDAIMLVNQLTQKDPLNKIAWYFRAYLAGLCDEWNDAQLFITIAKVFWSNDEDIDMLYKDIYQMED